MNRLCVYCQTNVATTVDHVPPKLMFPKPRPSTLVTVPSCEDCNKGAQKDDEYFGWVLSLRTESQNERAVKRLHDTTLRSFIERSPKFQTYFLEQTRVRGSKMQMRPDRTRLRRVVDRTIRGLHFDMHEVPLERKTPIYIVDDMNVPRRGRAGASIAKFLANFDDSREYVIEPGVFAYRRESVVGDESKAAWLLIFFQRLWFIGLVGVDVNEVIRDVARRE